MEDPVLVRSVITSFYCQHCGVIANTYPVIIFYYIRQTAVQYVMSLITLLGSSMTCQQQESLLAPAASVCVCVSVYVRDRDGGKICVSVEQVL